MWPPAGKQGIWDLWKNRDSCAAHIHDLWSIQIWEQSPTYFFSYDTFCVLASVALLLRNYDPNVHTYSCAWVPYAPFSRRQSHIIRVMSTSISKEHACYEWRLEASQQSNTVSLHLRCPKFNKFDWKLQFCIGNPWRIRRRIMIVVLCVNVCLLLS